MRRLIPEVVKALLPGDPRPPARVGDDPPDVGARVARPASRKARLDPDLDRSAALSDQVCRAPSPTRCEWPVPTW